MARLIGVRDQSDKLEIFNRQLPIPVDDDKVMILQLGDLCEYCQLDNEEKSSFNKEKPWSEETFLRQYSKLSREEALAATMVPAKALFSRLAQVVGCVGCRRSVEHLFNQLKESGDPSMGPLIVTSSGLLTVFMNCSLQPKVLNTLFSEHKMPLNEMLESIPKYKRSGRCVLHSMEGVRYRSGSHSWLEMWEAMTKDCRETITFISCDQLLTTLDNYLRKHRFCHECKNKVHRAYNILVGNISIDPNKEKGYVASLYSGIKQYEKTHVHVTADTDFVMHLITRAEPELQGRRERHAKTLEIAQEEVLTCVGLFLYERLQRVHSRMREEEQAFDILFHVGLDAIRSNFELAVEEKQGFSKFEKLCEELQQQELIEKAKKEKRNKKKKNKKKNEESKENNYICEEEPSCDDCESIRSSPLKNSSSSSILQQSPLKSTCQEFSPMEDDSESKWRMVGSSHVVRKVSEERERSERSYGESKDTLHNSSPDVFLHHHSSHHHQSSSPQHLECSVSIDSLASRCSQCSRDGGYCSAQYSSGSSRDSSEVACGDGFCSHSDDLDPTHHDHLLDNTHRESSVDRDSENVCDNNSHSPTATKQNFPSLQEMLEDFSCETDEIPEAEVKAWQSRQGAVIKQKRDELRQTLRHRFQQLCHRKSLSAINGNLNGINGEENNQRNVPLRCHNYVNGFSSISK